MESFKISAFSQDEVTWIRFIAPPPTLHTHTHARAHTRAHTCTHARTCTLKLSKNDKMYKRMIFMMLNVKKKSLRLFWGENQGESYNSSMFTALREFANIQARGTQAKPIQLTELKSPKWDLGRPKVLETAGQSTERTKLQERIVEIYKGSLKESPPYWLVNAYEETAWSLGKNHPLKLKITVLKAHTG